MKITPLQQYLLFGVFLLAGLIALYYQFLIKPINIEIGEKIGIRDQKKKDLEEAKKIVAKYSEFKKRADSVQRELEWIQNRIPKTIEKPKLLEAISLVQKNSGVLITSLQFENVAQGANPSQFNEVPVSVRFISSYQGLINFLYQTSVSNLVMTTKDLTVSQYSDLKYPAVTLSAQLKLSGIQAK